MKRVRGGSVPPWLVAVLLVAVLAATSSDAADVRPTVGHRAPDFTLRDPDGKPVQLSRVLGERAVLVNFWATWCPPCREEMPTMERVYRDYKARGLEILAVNIDAGDPKAVAGRVKEFMAELKLTFPALLDSNGEVVRAYRLRGLPTTFLIDRQGIVRAVEIGYRDWADTGSRKKLEELLK
ncbi:MAG TPA: TlpA disulfide reductase family protein [Methylomirabilota bacterium]|nr:TlpA disulfide reductase family protein [Methylomirabilota bacterium]